MKWWWRSAAKVPIAMAVMGTMTKYLFWLLSIYLIWLRMAVLLIIINSSCNSMYYTNMIDKMMRILENSK